MNYDRLLQLGGIDREVPPIPGYITKEQLQREIDGIGVLIPEEASDENQLADKAYVNTSVATASATFRGTYNLVTDLNLTTAATHADVEAALAAKMTALSITPDENDYSWVEVPTADDKPTEIARVERYKYNGTAWAYEWALNTSGFTTAQWAAINSGITSELVTAFGAKYDLPSSGIPKTDLANDVQESLGKADTAVQDAYSTSQADAKFVDSTQVRHIVSMTQAEYDLITPDANTLYYII